MHQLLIYFSIVSPLLVIFWGAKNKKHLDVSMRLIFYLSIASFFSDIISLILSKYDLNNLWIIQIWGLTQGILLFLFFSTVIDISIKRIRAFLVLFIIYYVINSIFIEGLNQYNSLAMSIEAIIMIVLCFIYFHKLYTDEVGVFLERIPVFWVVIGILFYFSGALFSFLLSSDILSKAPDRFYNSWIFHNSVNIIKNILFAIGLWKVRAVA